jgi:6-phosphofructokinase 1
MLYRLEEKTGIETRATVLGHIQRGGNPTCKDRVFASAMGAKAVELVCEGATNRVVGFKNGKFDDFDIQEALAMDKGLDPYLFHITKKLTTRI